MESQKLKIRNFMDTPRDKLLKVNFINVISKRISKERTWIPINVDLYYLYENQF